MVTSIWIVARFSDKAKVGNLKRSTKERDGEMEEMGSWELEKMDGEKREEEGMKKVLTIYVDRRSDSAIPAQEIVALCAHLRHFSTDSYFSCHEPVLLSPRVCKCDKESSCAWFLDRHVSIPVLLPRSLSHGAPKRARPLNLRDRSSTVSCTMKFSGVSVHGLNIERCRSRMPSSA